MLLWSGVNNEAGEGDVGISGSVNGFVEPLLDDFKKSVKRLTILRVRLGSVGDLMN